MLIRPFLFSLVALVWASTSLLGQPSDRTLELNLATPTLVRTVEPGTYRLRITNRLPDEQYTLEVLREPIPIPPIPKFPRTGNIPFRSASCASSLRKLRDSLDATEFETALRRTLALWEEDETTPETCREQGRIVFREVTTEEPDASYLLGPQEQLRIKIARRNAAGTSTNWEFVASTEPRGEWRTIYGFTFVPDHDQRYYARQLSGQPTKFVITRERDASEGLATRFLPSMLFVWSPTHYRNFDVSPGFAGGLGYNFDRLAVLLGVALTYNENLTVTVGAAMHEQARLFGQYRPGDTIASALTANQLHVERFLPNLYFGIALRLGENPFARSEEAREGGSKPTDAPENAAPKPTATDTAQAAGGANNDSTSPKFDVSTLRESGDVEIGGWTASVSMADDSVIVLFEGPFPEVPGTYLPPGEDGQTVPCMAPSEGARTTLPSPKEDVIERICFAADAVGKFGDAEKDSSIVATFHNLRIAVPKAGPAGAVYTATLESVMQPQ